MYTCINWVKMWLRSESYKVPVFFASLSACRSLLISLSIVPSLPLLSGAAHTTAMRRRRTPVGCIWPAFELLVTWCLPNCIDIVAEPQETSLDGLSLGRATAWGEFPYDTLLSWTTMIHDRGSKPHKGTEGRGRGRWSCFEERTHSLMVGPETKCITYQAGINSKRGRYLMSVSN